MRTIAIGSLVLMTAAAPLAQGCDARKQALNVFSRQGLNLLRPARDYIAPGGLVFIAKNGVAEYDDPREQVSAEPGNLTDFRAVILAETQKRSTAFATALDLANWILPIPIGLKSSGNRQVSLAGIETTGVRMQTAALDALIRRQSTADAAIPELKRGLRVFVVQEIYKATSMDLQATSNQKLDVALNDGTAVAMCAAAPGAGAKPEDAKAAEAKAAEAKAAEAKAAEAKAAEAKSADSKAAEAKAAEAKAAEAKAAAAKAAEAAAAQAKEAAAKALPSLGISVCAQTEFTLKLNTANPIPFAVRLAELELSGGQLRRRRGAAAMNTTLGAGEIAAARVDSNEPVVQNLTRRQR